jgi:hypothetical protein
MGDSGLNELRMAFSTIVDVLYVVNILYYTVIDDTLGIRKCNVELENIKLQLTLLLQPFPYPFMLCLVFCFHIFDNLLKFGFIPYFGE